MHCLIEVAKERDSCLFFHAYSEPSLQVQELGIFIRVTVYFLFHANYIRHPHPWSLGADPRSGNTNSIAAGAELRLVSTRARTETGMLWNLECTRYLVALYHRTHTGRAVNGAEG